MSTLPIHEYFYTWQGEGVHTGRSAFFIRTYGCPVHCPWCDSAGTWHTDYRPGSLQRLTAARLRDLAVESGCMFVVITGGEPTIHDLRPLVECLNAAAIPVHLETCGAFPVCDGFAWITVSPKWQKPPLPEVLSRASELKIIVEDEHSVDRWWQQLEGAVHCDHVWLHPEWSQRNNPRVLAAISRFVKENGDPFRAGWQLHKNYNVDALDPHSAKPVPLGGNPALGY